jgi:hypothetical protein
MVSHNSRRLVSALFRLSCDYALPAYSYIHVFTCQFSNWPRDARHAMSINRNALNYIISISANKLSLLTTFCFTNYTWRVFLVIIYLLCAFVCELLLRSCVVICDRYYGCYASTLIIDWVLLRWVIRATHNWVQPPDPKPYRNSWWYQCKNI